MPTQSRGLVAIDSDTPDTAAWLTHLHTPIYEGFSESGVRLETLTGFDGRFANPLRGGVSPSDPQAFVQPQTGVAPNGLPIFNWNQAAAQIARDSSGWGAGATVTFAFRATAPNQMPNGVTGFQQFNAAQIAVALESLTLWAETANITFLRIDDGAGYSNNATMLFSNYTAGAANASAFAYYPGVSANSGDVWVNLSLDTNNSNLIEGAFGPHTLTHEIGHAIGLAHPANYDASDAADPTYPASAVYWQDSRMYTVMSYFGSAGPGGNLGGFASGPQLHDIAAAQLLYGANMSTRTGDTVYGFNSNTGHAHFSITLDEATPVFAIWDAGGNDTLDLSGYSTTVEIDLREEAFSSAGPGSVGNTINNGRAYGNISIARGAIIENGIGGAGNDLITGNAVANSLRGNAGDDRLVGGVGNDALNGGGGIDIAGYSLASSSGSWARNPDGTWTVTAGAEGVDTLTGVEVLNFTDRNVVLDNAFRTFTGDGTSDLLWRNANTGAVAVWQVSGATQTNAYIAGGAPGEWSILGTGDFSGDGRDDIIWRNTTTTAVAVWADGSGTAASIITGVPGNWQFQGVGDFNFDGRDDFVWRNTNDGAVAVWLMNGNTIANQAIVSAAPAAWNIAGIADFDGDGRDDILLRNTDGTVARWTTDGVTQTGAAIVGSAPSNWQIQGVGDFNGDGRADILFRNTSDGGLAMWQMNGNATLGVQMVGGAPLSWSIANVGDYNGDGRDDILWHNTDGTVALWTMNGFTVQNQAIVANVPTEWGLI
ncbi:MAG: M57 family metalloprotease [Alphaproteobacteria bacterium]|nr:M57 family metalloprotease [Alphaproteobacteria bacterium]